MVLTAAFGIDRDNQVIVFLIMDRLEKFPGREAVENMLVVAGNMSGTELEPVTSTTGQLGDWFYMRGYEGFEAPVELATQPVIGSRVFKIDGRTVAQFAVGTPEALKCLVFQFHASEFGVQLPQDGDWKIIAGPEWVGAVRQHGDHCFLIVFRGGKEEMAGLSENPYRQSMNHLVTRILLALCVGLFGACSSFDAQWKRASARA